MAILRALGDDWSDLPEVPLLRKTYGTAPLPDEHDYAPDNSRWEKVAKPEGYEDRKTPTRKEFSSIEKRSPPKKPRGLDGPQIRSGRHLYVDKGWQSFSRRYR